MSSSLLLELCARYAEPHRHYHTIEHIATMLHQGRGLALGAVQVLAIWFHDAVYDPRADDNEAQSAALARELLAQDGAAEAVVDAVAQIVLDTATHEPTIPESAAVIDLDLASLALPWDAFAANGAALRREYAHVSDAEFEASSRAFCARMLARPRLFWTPFGAGLEAAARANLRRVVEAQP